MRSGESAYEREQYDEAEAQFLLALQQLEEAHYADISLADNFLNLAKIYGKQGMYTKAERIAELALQVASTAVQFKLVPGSELTEYFDHLGRLSLAQQNYERAEKMFKRSYVINQALTDNEDPAGARLAWVSLASDMHNLAAVYECLGKYEEAEVLLRQSLEIDLQYMEPFLFSQQDAYIGPSSCVIATQDLYGLAKICAIQGKHNEAEQLYLRSIAIYKEHCNEADSDLAKLLNGYADLLRKTERFDEAKDIAAQAEDILSES